MEYVIVIVAANYTTECTKLINMGKTGLQLKLSGKTKRSFESHNKKRLAKSNSTYGITNITLIKK